MKEVNGLFLPDRENYLVRDIESSPFFAGKGTIQFKKFARAFPEIRNWRHAIDIGANLGIWTRVMAICFDKVSCFEPNIECHESFIMNNREAFNKNQVVLYPYALGHQEDTVKLKTDLKSTGFVRVSDEGNLEVSQYTLDSFEFKDVDFIKIDVEGWEHMVIKGAGDTIRRWKPTIILEQKPNNAELHGLKQFGARNLLLKMGMKEIVNISGDVIMGW